MKKKLFLTTLSIFIALYALPSQGWGMEEELTNFEQKNVLPLIRIGDLIIPVRGGTYLLSFLER